jgi:hypothetical protein
MAIAVSYTYSDGALREDLLDVLNNLSPSETQLVSGLGTSTASSIRHEYLIDTLAAVKANAQSEGADVTYHNETAPTRLYNYTQIFKQGYKVTDTERAVNTAAFSDRYVYEQSKALKLIKNDMEYALMRGSLASGQTNAVRQLAGVKASLSLITAQSGTSMSETMLNDYLQLVWDNTSTQVNAIYCPMYMKRKISGFTANSTKNVNAADKRLINSVDVYEADAASLVKLFPHRYVSISGTDTNYGLVGLNEDFFKVAYLRKPQAIEIAKTGDFTGGNVVTELTLEALHYNAGVWADAHL